MGLTLDETRDLLESLQRTLVEQQVTDYFGNKSIAPAAAKGVGAKAITIPLWIVRCLTNYSCLVCAPFTVGGNPLRTFSPLAQLLTERIAPELLYLETKFASLMSYGLTVDISMSFP